MLIFNLKRTATLEDIDSLMSSKNNTIKSKNGEVFEIVARDTLYLISKNAYIPVDQIDINDFEIEYDVMTMDNRHSQEFYVIKHQFDSKFMVRNIVSGYNVYRLFVDKSELTNSIFVFKSKHDAEHFLKRVVDCGYKEFDQYKPIKISDTKLSCQSILNNLSKEDLIRVIGVLHNATNGVDIGDGFDENEIKGINIVGEACKTYCAINNNWDIKIIEETG